MRLSWGRLVALAGHRSHGEADSSSKYSTVPLIASTPQFDGKLGPASRFAFAGDGPTMGLDDLTNRR